MLLQATLVVATAAVFAVVNQVVPDPYMDEVFHVPQTIHYYAGNWSVWDEKITTPPGLYILAVAYSKLWYALNGAPITLRALRSFNLFGELVALPLVLSLFPVKTQRLPGRVVVMLQLFPTMYFFSFLYYTDVWSTIFALLSVALSMRAAHASWASVLLKIIVGFLGTSIRQTNIIWVVYALAIEVLTVFVYPDDKGKDRADETWFMAANAKLEDVRCPADFANAAIGAVVRVWRGIKGTKQTKALKISLSYVPVLAGFGLFVAYNGGITLGDKNNHTASIHIPQLFYFASFTCAMSIPTVFPILSQAFNILLCRPFTLAFISSLIILATYTTTIVHPFILADNRHYTFYIWRRILNASPWSRYLFAPAYAVAMYIVFSRAVRRDKLLTSVAFLGACTAVLVPSPLIECRYFVVPYLIWRIRVAILQDERREARRGTKVAEYMEIGWYAVINLVTIGLFVGHSFEWPSEPGQPQRLMW